jgi:fructoselysine-6-P-deglycase FrlB-like protein
VGIVVLAPSGPTQHLGTRLAAETSQLGSPTWLIGDDAANLPPETDRLRVMTLPVVDEAFAPLLLSVPIQRLAAALARQRGRVPGILLRSTKVTETE